LERKKELLDVDSLDWADEIRFSELSFSAQRVALFLRAILAAPDLIILDEAFSGMDEGARDRCMLFLSKGETMVHQSKSKVAGLVRASRSDIDRFGWVKVPGLQDHQALLVVSHRKEEVPGCVREWLCLPEGGSGEIRTGRLLGPLELSESRWEDIWGLPPQPTGSSRKAK
jgi:ABC-type molybdenum transport system ATPase subunit/photorepair protein PhrA